MEGACPEPSIDQQALEPLSIAIQSLPSHSDNFGPACPVHSAYEGPNTRSSIQQCRSIRLCSVLDTGEGDTARQQEGPCC